MSYLDVSLPHTGREGRAAVQVADTEEEGGGQERVREDLPLPPALVLSVGGVVVPQLGLAGGGGDPAAHWYQLEQETTQGVNVLRVRYYFFINIPPAAKI